MQPSQNFSRYYTRIMIEVGTTQEKDVTQFQTEDQK